MTSDQDRQNWFKSSYSGPYNNSCLEACFTDNGTEVRDSKDPHGPTLRFDSRQWSRFLAQVGGERWC